MQSSQVTPSSGYLPSLDGWRAIAVIGVMLAHDEPYFWHYQGYGGWGVYLFFSISGILICGRILDEESKTGGVDLRSFYLRRIFRIQPAALSYLAVIAVLMLSGVLHESWRYWMGALFLYVNFLFRGSSDGSAFVGHFWTLAVEEHFYILLSGLLFAIRRRRATAIALAVMGLFLAKHLAIAQQAYHLSVSPRRSYWMLSFLLVPSFCAVLLRRTRLRNLAERYLYPSVAFAITTLLMMLRAAYRHELHWPSFIFDEGQTLLYCFTLWIIATMLHPRSLTTRLLEIKPLRFCGRLSYSFYLWHVLFFVPSFPGVQVSSIGLLSPAGRPWRYVASLGAALLSYYLVEKPFIRLGHRLAASTAPDAALRDPINQ